MSIRLRDLIRTVRECKTAADERAVIQKESAALRTAFKSTDTTYRYRNVAKLLYLHMLGYPTHFGQMESLNLISAPGFPDKRIGYLALSLLLDERQQVLMMATNSIKTDLNSPNPFITGLALVALGNIGSTDMSRDLCSEVLRLFKSSNAYVRKKAALCCVRMVRKCPELVEDILPATVSLMLTDKNHSVIYAALCLFIAMIKADPEAPNVALALRKVCSPEWLNHLVSDSLPSSSARCSHDPIEQTSPHLHAIL